VPDVLFVCPESISVRPAGVGIRFIELAETLQRHDLGVTTLTPDGLPVRGLRTARLTPENIRDHSSQSRVAMVQGHAANDFFAHRSPIPTIVDLYDPFIVENFQYSDSLGPKVFDDDRATLNRSLAEGDFFLCASDAQRHFYLGALVSIGKLTPGRYLADPSCRSLIDVVPFGVPQHDVAVAGSDEPRILFGGVYDWYAPEIAIDAVELLRGRWKDVTISFNRNPSDTPQSKFAAVERRASSSRVTRIHEWVAYADRLPFYASHSIALLTFPRTLETELAMRTRIFDYLAAGLPVISSSAPGTDAILENYGAGVVVRSDDPQDYANAVQQLLGNAAALEDARQGAVAWARENGWDKVAEPLVRFCREPRSLPSNAPERKSRLSRLLQGLK
jgi:glycosyltransferase involved in cell wall biosynthesis